MYKFNTFYNWQILALVTFTVDNNDSNQANSDLNNVKRRHKYVFQMPNSNPARFQKGLLYRYSLIFQYYKFKL
jgi:hypothetical protein